MKKFLLIFLILLAGCTKVYNDGSGNRNGNPTSPSTVVDRIEFRVFGTQLQGVPVTIRFADPSSGTTIVQSGVPYQAQVESRDASTFLFIEAAALNNLYSTLQVQIFVNGRLFREGFAEGFNLKAQASGTYQR